MNKIFTKICISPYSIANFTSSSNINDLEEIFSFLKKIISDHKVFDNVFIECVTDIYDYPINNSSFYDNLLEVFNFDDIITQHFFSELQIIIGEYIKYNNTFSMLNLIQNNNPLPILLPLTYDQSFLWDGLDRIKHTSCLSETLKINSDYIILNHGDEAQFISLCKRAFVFLEFHDDIEATLKTIKIGNYSNYIGLITHSLDVLNQSYLIISTESNKNLDDLNTIMVLSSKLGKRLECTRQGKNKVEMKFNVPKQISMTGKEMINCEYHLKIDEFDNGTKIPHGDGNPVRIYFGLKSYEDLPRKRLTVAHIGMHL